MLATVIPTTAEVTIDLNQAAAALVAIDVDVDVVAADAVVLTSVVDSAEDSGNLLTA